MRNILLFIGSAVTLISSVAYMLSIVRGQTRPQRTTRLLMAVIGGLSFAALFAGHDTAAIWLASTSFVSALIMWVLSLRRGVGGRDKLDYACIVLCAFGLGLWMLCGQSFFGLIFSIVADFVACVPSLYKSAKLPFTEIISFYALGAVSGICIALAADHTFAAQVYPLYIMCIDGLFAGVIWYQRRQRRAAGNITAST